jgi:hypothetical protein
MANRINRASFLAKYVIVYINSAGYSYGIGLLD